MKTLLIHLQSDLVQKCKMKKFVEKKDDTVVLHLKKYKYR